MEAVAAAALLALLFCCSAAGLPLVGEVPRGAWRLDGVLSNVLRHEPSVSKTLLSKGAGIQGDTTRLHQKLAKLLTGQRDCIHDSLSSQKAFKHHHLWGHLWYL